PARGGLVRERRRRQPRARCRPQVADVRPGVEQVLVETDPSDEAGDVRAELDADLELRVRLAIGVRGHRRARPQRVPARRRLAGARGGVAGLTHRARRRADADAVGAEVRRAGDAVAARRRVVLMDAAGGGVTGVVGAGIAVVADRRRARGARARLARLQPVARVAVAAARAVRRLDVRGAAPAGARAGLRDVTGARRRTAHGPDGDEAVRGAGGAGARAALRLVAHARSRAAQRAGDGEDIGRARGAGARAGLGHVAEAGRRAADPARASEVAAAGAAWSAVAGFAWIDVAVAALAGSGDDDRHALGRGAVPLIGHGEGSGVGSRIRVGVRRVRLRRVAAVAEVPAVGEGG